MIGITVRLLAVSNRQSKYPKVLYTPKSHKSTQTYFTFKYSDNLYTDRFYKRAGTYCFFYKNGNILTSLII